jgi:hypothetical protein
VVAKAEVAISPGKNKETLVHEPVVNKVAMEPKPRFAVLHRARNLSNSAISMNPYIVAMTSDVLFVNARRKLHQKCVYPPAATRASTCSGLSGRGGEKAVSARIWLRT